MMITITGIRFKVKATKFSYKIGYRLQPYAIFVY